MEQTINAAQIHKDFYDAEERLYVEAIGLSTGVLTSMNDKSRRLQCLGFGKSKPVKDCEQKEAKRKISGHLIHVIEYFRAHYPQNKFITEEEVKKLCGRYGLLLGDTGNYIGDVPEKNLREIENFKLKKEDWKEKEKNWVDSFGELTFGEFSRQSRRNPMDDDILFWDNPAGDLGLSASMAFMARRQMDEDRRRRQQREYDIMMLQMPDWFAKPNLVKEKEKQFEQPPFKICAPKQDFNTMGFEVREGYRLVWDPVVLQPVSREGISGHLIVTAWGEEASDEIVVNENKN